MNDFENYVYEPIDLCACYEPMFDAPQTNSLSVCQLIMQ